MMDMGSEDEAPMEDTEPAEMEGEEDPMASAESFDSFADTALNTALPMSERRAALKEAIMSCMGTDYPEESEGGESSLAAVFGS